MSAILVVEDNANLAFGLRNNLEIEGHAVEVAGDGEQALEHARRRTFDLIVLDLMLPGLDGFRVLRALRERDRQVAVLILTARGEEADKVRGLRLGADDYLTKPFGVLELLARIEALLRRAARPAGAPPAARAFGDLVVDTAARTVTRGSRAVDLSPKEFDLLCALLARRGAVASRLELLREVWGYEHGVTSRTVDTHVAGLRRKIEDDASAPRYVLTARKAGYRFAG